MGEEKKQGRFELSRRDFLKVSAAGAAAATALDWAPAPAMANIVTDNGEATSTFISTCPYCSAQCGQKVVVGNTTGKVYDIYGDENSPTNRGGLCSKGAGSFQLVNNARRLGVSGDPSDSFFAAQTYPDTSGGRSSFNYVAETGDFASGVAYKRIGNGDWQRVGLDAALTDIAGQMKSFQGTLVPGGTTASNATKVQFFGSSHMNNEQNYLYRKIVANFGTSRIEHQARI